MTRALIVDDEPKLGRLLAEMLELDGHAVCRVEGGRAALVELGYVSSKDDLKQLTSEAWRTKTAGAIGSAIDKFFSTRIAGATAGRGAR